MKTKTTQCPYCGEFFPHDCAAELGRAAKGVVTARKSASSRQNIVKARAARAAKHSASYESEAEKMEVGK